jgi:hypothetical protein
MEQLMITTTGGYTYFVSLHNVREAVVMVTGLGLGLIVKYFGEEEYGDYSGITNYTREDLETELNSRFKALAMKDTKL